MAEKQTKFCDKCKKTMALGEFYSSKNLEKYPDGHLNNCKKCTTLHVDNWDPKTFLWILQECDVPYMPEQWDKLLVSYAKDRRKVSGMTIIGRYIGKMSMTQFAELRWKDTERLQEIADKQTKEAMERQGYDAVEIAETIQENRALIPRGDVEIPEYPNTPFTDYYNMGSPNDDYFGAQNAEYETSFDDDLTDEDKKYLLLKWGKTYKPEEWVKLEQFYNDMKESYDIQGAGHEDILKLVCKTSLKSNQLLDIGDVDGAQKMTKMYDSLMKSGNFTAAQNKADNGDFVDSVGEIVELCEKFGYIERYYVDKPNDKVDFTIQDMQRYVSTLVGNETNLGNLIENAMKQNEKEDADAAQVTDDELFDLSFEDIDKELDTNDFEDFLEFQEEQMLEDAKAIDEFLGGE